MPNNPFSFSLSRIHRSSPAGKKSTWRLTTARKDRLLYVLRVLLSMTPSLYFFFPFNDENLFHNGLWSFLCVQFLVIFLPVNLAFSIRPTSVGEKQKIFYTLLIVLFDIVAVLIYLQLYKDGKNSDIDFALAMAITGWSIIQTVYLIISMMASIARLKKLLFTKKPKKRNSTLPFFNTFHLRRVPLKQSFLGSIFSKTNW